MEWVEPVLDPLPGQRLGSQAALGTYGPRTSKILILFLAVLMFTPWPSLAGPARNPFRPDRPFLVFWGVPDAACPVAGRPDPSNYGIEPAGRVALFYEDTLGLYPYFTAQGQPVNGGLPQHTRLDTHLQKTGEDLAAALPQVGYQGLGVLRWEQWAPQWGRNQDKQGPYLEGSRTLLRTFFPDWTAEELEKWSRVDFEAAGQSILRETLWEVRRLRPKTLWGMSPYPDCNNCRPELTSLSNYTGRCPTTEMALNDELMWLWKRCSALFPSLGLEKLQGGTLQATLCSTNQIQEALRVAVRAGTTYDLPVFPLVKSVYTSTNTFLTEIDLVNTIGVSAAMGTAGVIIWDRTPVKTQRACSELASFVREVLGPYTVNVTNAARLCSVSLCQGQGFCVRRDPESPAYLHLAPTDLPLVDGVGTAVRQDPANLERWKRDFRCQQYEEGAAADQSPQGTPKDPVGVPEVVPPVTQRTPDLLITEDPGLGGTSGTSGNPSGTPTGTPSGTPGTAGPSVSPSPGNCAPSLSGARLPLLLVLSTLWLTQE